MGRTSPTYRDALRATEQRWQAYRRTLRRHDRPHFDRLFVHGRAHADAAGMLNHPDPVVPLPVAALLAPERRLTAPAPNPPVPRGRRAPDPAQTTLGGPDAD